MSGFMFTLGMTSSVSWAQSAPPRFEPPQFEDEFEDEVVSTAERQSPSATSHIVPDITFGAGDIQSLGATDIGEVIDAINAEIGDQASGPPIILLDGRPVESRREIRRFPSEAIRRVEVLPPEASLKYSSSPNRRVINFILRPRFNALTQDIRAQTTTDGGRNEGRLGTNYLRIRNKTRLAMSLDYTASDPLSESQRGITERTRNGPYALGGNITAPNVGDEIDPAFSILTGDTTTVIGVPTVAATGALTLSDFVVGANVPNSTNEQLFRDLQAKREMIDFGASLFKPVGDRLSIKGALNADFARSTSQRGLIRTRLDIPVTNPFSPFDDDIRLFRHDGPLLREQDTSDIDGNIGVSADYPSWRWSVIAIYGEVTETRDTTRRLETETLQLRIDQNDPNFNPFGPLHVAAISTSDRTQKTGQLKALISGRVFQLPTGPVNGSLGAEVSNVRLNALSALGGVSSQNVLSRNASQLRAEVDIPLSGVSGQRRAAGVMSARLSGALDEIEGIGMLSSFGGGLNWNATNKLRLQASLDVKENPPSLEALGNPVLIDPNVRVTDFTTGDAVLVERLTGGNPFLDPEHRRDLQFTANYRHSRDLRFTTRFRSRRIKNDTRSFPFLTPQISNIFSDRLVRDASGELIRFDARPVNAFLTEQETLRTGFNWTKRFRRAPTGREPSRTGSQSNQTRSRGRAANTRPERGGQRRNRGGSDRVSLSLYHTLRLSETIQFRQNGLILDLLDGAALSRRGGQPTHEVEARVNVRRKNYGGAIFLTHESGKTLETDTATGNQTIDDLRFSPVTKTNLRLYYDLGRTSNGRRVKRESWRRNLRLTLDVNNIGNQRQKVQTNSGVIPFAYEPDALDPEGRVVRLTLRKMFSMRGRPR